MKLAHTVYERPTIVAALRSEGYAIAAEAVSRAINNEITGTILEALTTAELDAIRLAECLLAFSYTKPGTVIYVNVMERK